MVIIYKTVFTELKLGLLTCNSYLKVFLYWLLYIHDVRTLISIQKMAFIIYFMRLLRDLKEIYIYDLYFIILYKY